MKKVTFVNYLKRKKNYKKKIMQEETQPRRTQRDVLRDAFAEKGITNHVQSVYYSKLGNEVVNSRNRKMKALFPPVDGTDQTEEWQTAYGLIAAFLKEKKMELTTQSAKDFIQMTPPPIGECSKKVQYEASGRNIRNLVRDQKIFLLLNPDTLDYDLPREFYQVPKSESEN